MAFFVCCQIVGSSNQTTRKHLRLLSLLQMDSSYVVGKNMYSDCYYYFLEAFQYHDELAIETKRNW